MKQIIRTRQIVARLARIENHDKNITGPIGFLIGAAYALIEAARYGYAYGQIDDEQYSKELRDVATALANDRSVSMIEGQRHFEGADNPTSLCSIWLAGFYFNSALHRLAAGAERIGVHCDKGDVDEPDVIRRARRDVNKLKHHMKNIPYQEARGLLTGREVESLVSAVDALEALVDVCEEKGFVEKSV